MKTLIDQLAADKNVSPNLVRAMKQAQTIFHASYEDYEKAKAAARTRGWKGEDDLGDFIEFTDHQTGADFATLDEAVEWLKSEINALKSTFGCGDIDELTKIERRERCKYCVCNGLRPVTRYIVTDDGIESEEPAREDCHWGEP